MEETSLNVQCCGFFIGENLQDMLFKLYDIYWPIYSEQCVLLNDSVQYILIFDVCCFIWDDQKA